MYVKNICTEVLDGLLCGFVSVSYGMMNIPGSSDIVSGENVKYVTKSFSICIRSYCFKKKRNTVIVSFSVSSLDTFDYGIVRCIYIVIAFSRTKSDCGTF